jgi:hypothetical protein
MQLKAAKGMGNKLGGELAVAAKEGLQQGSYVVLGDRLYNVTNQRLFDKLMLHEKFKMVFTMLWEVLTMSLFKLKEYIQKSENEIGFIKAKIAGFRKWLPTFFDVIISERDEYIAETLCEISRVGFVGYSGTKRGRVLAVVGAGHMDGIERCIVSGGVSQQRILEISSSSKHPPQWPGRGMFQIVRPDFLFPHPIEPAVAVAATKAAVNATAGTIAAAVEAVIGKSDIEEEVGAGQREAAPVARGVHTSADAVASPLDPLAAEAATQQLYLQDD